MKQLGPVDYAVIAFSGNHFTGEIAPALVKLVDHGTIRIIDLTFVLKDETGAMVASELLELEPELQAALERDGVEVDGLFNDEDIEAAAEILEPGTSAALIVWENLWATEIAEATRNAGGELLDFGRIPSEIVEAARQWAAEHPLTEQEANV
jgi:hypothetical protein